MGAQGRLPAGVSPRAPGRTTRDLDLASALAIDVEPLRDALAEALDRDPDGDFFRFAITGASALRPDDAGQGGWRFSVEVRMAGRVFDRVRVDVVARVGETFGGTELVDLPTPLAGVDLGPARVLAVDVAQDAAEKSTRTAGATRGTGRAPGSRISSTWCVWSSPGCCPIRALPSGSGRSSRHGTAGSHPLGFRIHRRPGPAITRRSSPTSGPRPVPCRRPCRSPPRCTDRPFPEFPPNVPLYTESSACL